MPLTGEALSKRNMGNTSILQAGTHSDTTIATSFEIDGGGGGVHTSNNSSSKKEGDGRNSRRRRRRRCWLIVVLTTVLIGYQIAVYKAAQRTKIRPLPPATEVDPLTGKTVTRWRPELVQKKHKETGQVVKNSQTDGIFEGYLTLIDIYIPSDALSSSSKRPHPPSGGDAVNDNDDYYGNVRATFCHLSWALQSDNPSQVPMFRDLKSSSPLCAQTMYTTDLWQVARQIEEYDAGQHPYVIPNKDNSNGFGKRPYPPTAVIFHETRCGSTLLGNLFAAFEPKRSRVYSEADPPLTAIMACPAATEQDSIDNKEEMGETTTGATGAVAAADSAVGECNVRAHQKLIQDVFMIMGRTPTVAFPKYVFYKFQSIGVHAISNFVRAMPETPWFFLYRNSVEIMMSHFKNYQRGKPLDDRYRPNCLRNYPDTSSAATRSSRFKRLHKFSAFLHKHNKNRGGLLAESNDGQYQALTNLVESKGLHLANLTKEEYCAAHIASLAVSAISQYQREEQSPVQEGGQKPVTAPIRWFVNYEDLPHVAWETLLPTLLEHEVKQEQKDRMRQQGRIYSKARVGEDDGGKSLSSKSSASKPDPLWQEDSTSKRARAPQSVIDAAALFLDPVYQEMEKIRKEIEAKYS